MDKMDQLRIVQEITDGLKKELIERLPKVRDTWDGFELRQWAVDVLTENWVMHSKMGRAAKRDYNRDRTRCGV